MHKLLINPHQESEASQKGLADVSTLMTVYEWQEKTYLQHDDARSSFKDSLISLYTMILTYEAALLAHIRHNSPRQWIDSIVKAGDWTSRLEDIREQDAKCRLITTAISEHLRSRWHNEEIKWQQDLLQQPRLAEESSDLRKLHSNYEAGKNVNPDRVPGTCHWFLDHVDFLTWRKSPSSRLLWLSADPGCGKSVLAKYLVDRRGEALTVRNSMPTVCYFFFKDGDIERRDGAKALCALLHQLFLQQPQLYRHAKEDFRTKSDSFLTDFNTLWNIFIKAVEDPSQSETICVLDALDECQEYSRKALIEKIVQMYGHEDIVGNRRPVVKFLITSRPEIDIVRDFTDLTEVRLQGEEESEKISQEIDLVIQRRIQDIGKRMRLSLSQQSSLQSNLTSIPQRTYLWLHLTFDAIEKRVLLTGKDIAAIVKVIPENLDQAYTAMLDKSADKDMARKLLHIILAAKRPLSLEEVNVVFAIDERSEYYNDLDTWPTAGSSDLVKNICGLFISIVDSKIYLIHQTAREFLLGEEQSGWRKSFRLAESNLVLAKACIWLLQLRDLEETDCGGPKQEFPDPGSEIQSFHPLSSAGMNSQNGCNSIKSAESSISIDRMAVSDASSKEQSEEDAIKRSRSVDEASSTDEKAHSEICTNASFEDDDDGWSIYGTKITMYDEISRNTLYNYVIFHWTDHFVDAASLCEPSLVDVVANRICETSSRSFQNWATWFSTPYHDDEDFFSFSATNLAVASYLGLTTVVKLLLDQGSKKNLDSTFEPIHAAVHKGHLVVVDLLLKHGAKVDSMDWSGNTPLHRAAEFRHEEIADLLLKWGARVDSTNDWKATPLHCAASWGSEGILNLLVVGGAKVDALDSKGQTPLFLATMKGYESICKLLLMAGARIDITDDDGSTVLHYAASRCWEVIGQMFLDRGLDMNLQDHNGRTALFDAVERGGPAMVKLLLERGARADLSDKYGRTPYLIAEKQRRRYSYWRAKYDEVLELLKNHGNSE